MNEIYFNVSFCMHSIDINILLTIFKRSRIAVKFQDKVLMDTKKEAILLNFSEESIERISLAKINLLSRASRIK